MTNKELNELVNRYAMVNEDKKEIMAEAKELGAELKDELAERDITAYETDAYIATISTRTTRTLNKAKIEALLKMAIPEDCYDLTTTEVLTIKAVKATAKAA